jgi:general secretion pathway protein C
VQKYAVPLLTFAALVLLGAVLSHWTWVWLTPRAAPRAQPVAAPASGLAAAGELFGAAPRAQGGGESVTGAIKLLGVVAAARGRPGHAIVQSGTDGTRVVREGDAIRPGVRLAAVKPGHIVLERAGGREILALRKDEPQ